MADMPGTSEEVVTRKVRVHKKTPAGPGSKQAEPLEARNKAMDRAIAEIIPQIADLSISGAALASATEQASELRRLQQAKEARAKAEALELSTIYDITRPHPLDNAEPSQPYQNKTRPEPRKIVLSPYQYEMINYQRMLLRKNIWYYRDRMNVPRGPCPLHVLKDCWVQGMIDENTLMWGHGLYDWLPAKNIKLLLPMIRTPEVQLGAWIKKTFSLKPSLNKIRETQKQQRDPMHKSDQVDRMR